MHAYLSLSSLSDEFLLNLSEYEYDYVYEYEYESVSLGCRSSVTLLSLTSPFRDPAIPDIHIIPEDFYTGRYGFIMPLDPQHFSYFFCPF